MLTERRKLNRIKAPLKNRLLASLSESDQNKILPLLERVKLVTENTALNTGERFTDVIFPTTSIISLKFDSQDGRMVEVGAIGNEGLVGSSFMMGIGITALRMHVIYSGYGYRIKSKDFYRLLEVLPSLKSQITLYAQLLFAQTCVNVACNRLHSIEQQYAKLLLFTADSLATNNLLFSHQSMSARLGVRRESVTTTSKKLKDAEVIDYSRGKFMILNRSELQNMACECYLIFNKELSFLYKNKTEDSAA